MSSTAVSHLWRRLQPQRCAATRLAAPAPHRCRQEHFSLRKKRNCGVVSQVAPPQSLEEFDINFGMPLGHGAVGTVFPGEHRGTSQMVAIKTVASVALNEDQGHTLDREDRSNSIAHETRAFQQVLSSGLSHPNVVNCVGCFQGSAEEAIDLGLDLPAQAEEEPLHYFVMELLGGRTVSDILIESAAIDEKQAFSITRAVCDGLDCLHKNGIVHRDVKPGNIMISHSDHEDVKLFDFSHAGVMGKDDAAEAAMLTQKLGTQGYIAPEVLSQKESYTAKCDVYSVGCTLHAMLSRGRVPRRHPRVGIVTSLPDSVSPHGRALVESLVAYAPQDRPTIAELLNEPCLQE